MKTLNKKINNYNMCNYLHDIGYNDFFTSDYGIGNKVVNNFNIFNRIEIYKNQNIDYFLKYSTILKRRSRIELSKLRMRFFPNTYSTKTINVNAK